MKFLKKNKFKILLSSFIIGLSIYSKCKNENINLKHCLFKIKKNTFNFLEQLYLNPKSTFNEILEKDITFNQIIENSFTHLLIAYFFGKLVDDNKKTSENVSQESTSISEFIKEKNIITEEMIEQLAAIFKQKIGYQNNLCFFKAMFVGLFLKHFKEQINLNPNETMEIIFEKALEIVLNEYKESVLNKKFQDIQDKMNFGQIMFSIPGFISFNSSNLNQRENKDINSKDDAFIYMFNKRCLEFYEDKYNGFINNCINGMFNEEINSEEKFNKVKENIKTLFENKIKNITQNNYFKEDIEKIFKEIKYINENKEKIRLYKLILEDIIKEIKKIINNEDFRVIESLYQSVQSKADIINNIIFELNQKINLKDLESINEQIKILNEKITKINKDINENKVNIIEDLKEEDIEKKYLHNLKVKKDNLYNEFKECFNKMVFFANQQEEYLNYKSIIDKINKQEQNEFTQEELAFYNQKVKEFQYNETYDNLNQILINNYKLIKADDFKNVHKNDEQEGIYLKILVPYQLDQNTKNIILQNLNIQNIEDKDYFNLINGNKETLNQYNIPEETYNKNKINLFANIKGGTHYTIMYDQNKTLDLMNENICEKFKEQNDKNKYFACLSINLQEKIGEKTILDIILESSLSEACFENAQN